MERHQLRPQILTYTSMALLGMLGRTDAWWGAGAPECAQPCLSSAWSAASTTSWPAPTDWCASDSSQNSDIQSRKNAASSCLASACSATPTAHSSYSSLSSSLCAQYSSCSSAGSTGVYTVSLPAFTGAWDGGHDGNGGGPIGGWWGAGHGGPTGTGTGRWGPHHGWAGTATWTGGVYTVTGCEWDGSPWAGGPWGWGHGHGGGGDYGNGQPNGPWGVWGAGWTLTSTGTKTVTAVQTITRDATGGDGSVTKVMELTTSTGLATVGYAVNEESKEEATTVLGAVEAAASTTGSSNGAASFGAGASMGVVIGAAVLGGVVVVAGLL